MAGSVENENGWVGPPPYELPDDEMLELFTTRLAGNDAAEGQKLLALYKRRHPETRNRMLWLMADSDDTRRWNAQLLCRLKHEQGTAPAYLYFFDWQSPVHNNRMGSYHTLDIPFVFYNMDLGASMTGSANARYELGHVMSAAWAAFARTGNPNHADMPNWPTFEPNNLPTMMFGDDGARRERPEQGRAVGARGAAREAAVVTCAAQRALVGFAAAAAFAAAAHVGYAQNRQSGGTVEDQFVLPVPTVEKPPRDFKTAEEHYNFLLERANGGTKHTMQTIPVWDGLWGSGNNTMPAIFLENGTLANAWRPGATKIKEGVLTPPYEQHFRERRAEIDQYGEQRYDRLTNCEYPGVPRWLWEPYIKEFVNMPTAVVADERHDERDAARLYRQRARQHREQALAARRQHRLLGRRQARRSGRSG